MAGSGGVPVDNNEYYWTYDAVFFFFSGYSSGPVILKGVYGALDLFNRLLILDEGVIGQNKSVTLDGDFAEQFLSPMYEILKSEVGATDVMDDLFGKILDACYADPGGYADAVAKYRDNFLGAASGIEDDSDVAALATEALNAGNLDRFFERINFTVLRSCNATYTQASSSKAKPQYSWAVSGGGWLDE